MTKDEEILLLKAEIRNLKAKLTEQSWKLNPDRSGGQFSAWEKNRRGDEFS